jgi:hypothetical protein
MQLHLSVAVMAPALYCLILVLPGRLGRRVGVLIVAFYVAYLAAAVCAGPGMVG